MEILEIRAYEGKNIYCLRPVIKMKLALGEFDKVESKEKGDFNQRLIKLIPSLNNHYCSRRKVGGFVERLHEGTYFGHIIEHVALELQTLAGTPVIYGKTMRDIADNGVYEIIMECKAREGAITAARWAVRLVKSLLAQEEVNLEHIINEIKEISYKTELGPSTKAIYDAAIKRNIPIMRLGEGSILQLGYGKHLKKIAATITEGTSCIGVDISCDKTLTKELLGQSGIPIPEGGVARTLEGALEIAKSIGERVVIKPYDGNQGKGVSLNLKDPKEITRAFEIAANLSERIIVEKYITGRNYRLIVVGNQLIAASERLPAFVTGDGEHNIKELVDMVNSAPERGEDHEKPLTKINIDSITLSVLTKQKLTTKSIPPLGENVILKESANISTGGIAMDVTDLVHPDNREIAIRAAKIIGLDVAGIDIVTDDISKSIYSNKGAIIEVNAAPGIRMHHYPYQGQVRDVAGAIVDHLFPQGTSFRIPIISITGTNGKTTTTRLIGHTLKVGGVNVGMTTTDGIYIGGKVIMRGDTTGPQSAKAVLSDPTVDIAVLETARGGLIRAGLGYDVSDVGIITNISPDHLGQNNIETLEDLAHVKALVAEAVKEEGYTVINADDPMVVKIRGRVKSNIIYFSKDSDNFYIRRHLGAGGTAVFVKNGYIVLAKGKTLRRVISVRSIPITFGGIALHNIENSLAATAGCIGLGLPIDQIREGLLTFQGDIKFNPGRLNVIELNGVKIIIDYGHNEAGYRSIINMIKRLKAKKLIGVIAAPGDRLDEHIIKVGEAAGEGFHQLIIKEDADLRGRVPGHVAKLLEQGAKAGGLNSEQITTILNEPKAVQHALEIAQPGEVVVVFYEKLESVLDIIELTKLRIEKSKRLAEPFYQEEEELAAEGSIS